MPSEARTAAIRPSVSGEISGPPWRRWIRERDGTGVAEAQGQANIRTKRDGDELAPLEPQDQGTTIRAGSFKWNIDSVLGGSDRASNGRWLPRPFHGTGVLLVVGVVALCVPAGEAEPVVEVAARVVVVVVLAGAVLVTVVAGVLWVTVVVGLLVVTVDVGLAFLFAVAEPPKNVVGWPLSVIERPARRSGTV
jgi:hypothetical protein